MTNSDVEGIETQDVWRSISKHSVDGFFVWEILECVGVNEPKSYMTECLDGSYILESCYHYWTQEKAEKAFYVDEWVGQRIHLVANSL